MWTRKNEKLSTTPARRQWRLLILLDHFSFTNAARHVSALSSKLLGVRFSATSAGVMSTSDRSSSTAANRRWESTSREKD
uniref:Uncharacterized protein n=1 Tax=Oryza meridionalis TaxID=40149 RepID=A0A0E0D8F2_9ORYZ